MFLYLHFIHRGPSVLLPRRRILYLNLDIEQSAITGEIFCYSCVCVHVYVQQRRTHRGEEDLEFQVWGVKKKTKEINTGETNGKRAREEKRHRERDLGLSTSHFPFHPIYHEHGPDLDCMISASTERLQSPVT